MKQMELNFKKKQRHLAWVCVGTSEMDAVPTWFYAFRTHDKAQAFVDQTKGVAWEIYPCELEEPDEPLANFEVCMKAVEMFDAAQPVREFVEPRSLLTAENFINKLKEGVNK